MNLSQIKANTSAVILSLSSHKCDSLREMGFCEQAKIKKIKDGRLLICDICNCKIAISKDLAQGIEVEVVD
jgi:Fe2+ transport system protein FeoA